MNTYLTVKKYFKELSRIPRIPLKEEKMRAWIIEWAHKKNWIYTVDEIGNLLVLAPGNHNKILCLQAHMDMVCVADKKYDFDTQGIKIIEKDGVIRAKNTSLGADNGVGIATMLTLADIANRPTLELLFTVGEEIGLVGAQNISIDLQARYGLNLDWSDSQSIGIGCGGTLLMQGVRNIEHILPIESESKHDTFLVKLYGMQGGHSGEDIRHYRGNAILELLKIITKIPGITHIGEILGGEADNAIPHAAHMVVRYEKNPNLLKNELDHLQKILRKKFRYETITLSAEETLKNTLLYRREDILPTLSKIIDVGTGVQIWGNNNTPLSSWNLGILKFKDNTLSSSYFLRTNLKEGMEIMKNTLITELAETVWTMSHESPPWNNNSHSELLSHIQESFLDEENSFLPLISTHAAVECGILSQKYPQTEWISIGVTISDMHTTRESIKEEDFKIFIERMEKFIENKI